MKKPVTINDLESAFKALDEIKIPKVAGLRPNKQDISNSYQPNRVDRTSMLVEEYYNIAKEQDLQEAQEILEKEKENKTPKMVVVDLNAGSAKELQNNYVGKGLLQCPQCMNIFFKDTKDIVGENGGIETVTIGDTVNTGEICQHCGNDTGYIFGGWVGEEQPEAQQEATNVSQEEGQKEEQPEEQENTSDKQEQPEEDQSKEEQSKEPDFNIDFGDLELTDEETQPEEEQSKENTKKEESFNMYFGMPLVEEADSDVEKQDTEKQTIENNLNKNVVNKKELANQLTDYLEYLNYLQKIIDTKKEQLNKETNSFIKEQLKTELDGLQTELDNAIPEKIKTEAQLDKLPAADEIPDEAIENIEPDQEQKNESLHEGLTEAPVKAKAGKFANKQIYLRNLQNDTKAQQAVVKELKKPITEDEVEALLNGMPNTANPEETAMEENLDDESFNTVITEYFKRNYKNINNFTLTDCFKNTNKLILEGIIKFNSGNKRKINLSFKTNKLQEEARAKIRTLNMLPNNDLKESFSNIESPILACRYLKNGLIKAIKLN